MELRVLGSGSSGNGYLLVSNHDTLLIECGVKFSEVKRALDFDLSILSGCVATHSHGDHFKYATQVIAAGVDLYCSEGTFKESGLKMNHRTHAIRDQESFWVGSFKILPFEVKHDTLEPLNFLIAHPEMGNLLFLTDTWYCPFKFKNLNQIMLEINYAEDILRANTISGRVSPFVADRVRTNHIELQTGKDLLLANDLSQVQNIVLLHLSDANSNAFEFERDIYEQTKIPTIVAERSTRIQFNKYPF